MNNATIRQAVAEDSKAIVAFLDPFIRAKQLLPRSESEVQTLLPYGFVAESEGAIVGFAAVEIYSTKLAEIQCLAVSNQFRRQGIGKQLVERCVQVAKEREVCELMAITSMEQVFVECGFDYSLPDQKRALFIQTKQR